jgi:hypothetical protein
MRLLLKKNPFNVKSSQKGVMSVENLFANSASCLTFSLSAGFCGPFPHKKNGRTWRALFLLKAKCQNCPFAREVVRFSLCFVLVLVQKAISYQSIFYGLQVFRSSVISMLLLSKGFSTILFYFLFWGLKGPFQVRPGSCFQSHHC